MASSSIETTPTTPNTINNQQPNQITPNTINNQQTNPITLNTIDIQQPILVAPLSSFAQSITKLNKSNFMTWRGLVEPFLHGHDLYGFIDGTNTPSSTKVSTSPGGTLTVSTDPDTIQWLCHDQLVLSMLMSSISDEMLPQVLGWTFDNTFTSESQARVLALRLQLTTAKKGNLSVSDYYQQIKHTVATLAAAGHQRSRIHLLSTRWFGFGI
jgi:hypothetical protein